MGKLIPYAFFLVGVMLAVLGGPSVYETFSVWHDVDSFTPCDATVITHTERKHRRGPSTEVVKFRYTVDGHQYTGDNHLTELSDDADDVAAQIHRDDKGVEHATVYYDPDNPRRVVLHHDIHLLIPMAVVGFTLLALFGGVQAIYADRKQTGLDKAMARRREQRRQEQQADDEEDEGEETEDDRADGQA